MHDDLSLIPSVQVNATFPIILIASDTRRPESTGDTAYCDGFVGNPPVLCSAFACGPNMAATLWAFRQL